jgi:ferredoxin-thioredoxin reductase catalytic subunit
LIKGEKYFIIRQGVRNMSVKLNEDKAVVERIKNGLKEKDGFCPCKLGKLPENKCMCDEFKAQIADPDFEGYCHCMLYYKSK